VVLLPVLWHEASMVPTTFVPEPANRMDSVRAKGAPPATLPHGRPGRGRLDAARA